jgi:ABC-type transport system involved in cytochrome c biogenesis permease component
MTRTATTAFPLLLPLLIPASIAAAGAIWGWARRRRMAPESAPVEISVTVVTVVHHVVEARR